MPSNRSVDQSMIKVALGKSMDKATEYAVRCLLHKYTLATWMAYDGKSQNGRVKHQHRLILNDLTKRIKLFISLGTLQIHSSRLPNVLESNLDVVSQPPLT